MIGGGVLPLVSICVPTRNRGASLRDSIRNICAQDYAALDARYNRRLSLKGRKIGN